MTSAIQSIAKQTVAGSFRNHANSTSIDVKAHLSECIHRLTYQNRQLTYILQTIFMAVSSEFLIFSLQVEFTESIVSSIHISETVFQR